MTADRGPAFRAGDRSDPLADHTVGGLLVARAAEHPGRTALVGVRHGGAENVRLTYGDVLDEARRVAAALRACTAPGDYVALWAPNVLEWTVIQYGAALAGVVLVAVNPVLRDDDLDYVLRHSRARLLLHAERSRDYAMGDVARRVCAAIPGIRCRSLSEWGQLTSATPLDLDLVGRIVDDPDVPAMLQYTSGTTGRPKGVLLTHRALVNVARLTMAAAEIEPAAVFCNPLPLFHTAGCVIATLGPAWVGGTVVMPERFVADTVLDASTREGVSVLFYVPTILAALVECQRGRLASPPDLRMIMGGAAAVSAELIDGAADVFGAEVLNLYGQTELAPVLSLTRPGDDRGDRLHTVGRPLPHVDCKISDPETGDTLPVGEVGEIRARGYQQFVEYLHDPVATARALDDEGFVRTGDLGVLDERGYLAVAGRLKDLIIRGGENIAPAEVEAVINQHDDVLEAVAVALPDDRLGEVVAVACRLEGSTRSGLRHSLAEFARSRMPAYKVPARWFVTDEFPVTPTGKVQRFALRDAMLDDRLVEL